MWNEQGEITSIEGTLTICFCYISPCCHIDSWKQLYLAIRIPNLVNVSMDLDNYTIFSDDVKKLFLKGKLSDEDKITLFKWMVQGYRSLDNWADFRPHIKALLNEYIENKERIKKLESKIQENNSENFDFGLGDPILPDSFDRYSKLLVEGPELKKKINKLEKKIEDLIKVNHQQKGEINFLKSYLGKDDSEWIIIRDLARRTNPIPDEPNEFGFPLNFVETKVYNLKTSEKTSNWCYFRYYYNDNYPKGEYSEYDMPWSLYEFLSGRIPKNVIETKQKIKKKESPKTLPKQLLTIKNQDEFYKQLESHDIYPDSIEKVDKVYNFLDQNRERTFSRKRFSQFCQISPKTVTSYLNYLKKSHLVFQIPGKTKYKVNLKETKSK